MDPIENELSYTTWKDIAKQGAIDLASFSVGKLLGAAAKSGGKYAELAEKLNHFKQATETVYLVGSAIKELSEKDKDKIGLYTSKNYYGDRVAKLYNTQELIYVSEKYIDKEKLVFNLFIIDQLLEGATIEGIDEKLLGAFIQAQNEVMGKEAKGEKKMDIGEQNE